MEFNCCLLNCYAACAWLLCISVILGKTCEHWGCLGFCLCNSFWSLIFWQKHYLAKYLFIVYNCLKFTSRIASLVFSLPRILCCDIIYFCKITVWNFDCKLLCTTNLHKILFSHVTYKICWNVKRLMKLAEPLGFISVSLTNLWFI